MNFKQYSIIMLFLLLTIGNATFSPTCGIDLSFKNKYVWRGAVFNKEPVFWPDLWVNWQGFTIYGWASLDLTDVKQKQFNLTDLALYLDYTYNLQQIPITGGFVLYTYPTSAYDQASNTTGELYAKKRIDLNIMQCILGLNYDIIEVKGFYASPGIVKGLPVGPANIEFGITLGFANGKHNNYYYGLNKTCFADLNASLKLTYTPAENFSKFLSITGDLNLTTIIDSELKDCIEINGDVNNIYGGVSLGIAYSFGD